MEDLQDDEATRLITNDESVSVIGQTIGDGKYQITRLLGEGGMGAVYYGVRLDLEKPVAIKLLHPEIARQPVMLERFRNEAKAIARLDRHPGIVQVLDFGIDHTLHRPYLVTEFLEGCTLGDYLAQREAPNSELEAVAHCRHAAWMISETCKAVSQAHRYGVVHRDLKPDNIFLVRDENDTRIKVMDFGIAKMSDTSKLTQTNAVLGTPHYMSPEQCRGDPATTASDIYALGAILFELVTGRTPYDADNNLKVMAMHQFMAVPDPASPIPPLDAIIMRCLAKEPTDRFGSANDLREALDHCFSLSRASVMPETPSMTSEAQKPMAVGTQMVTITPARRHKSRQLHGIRLSAAMMSALAICLVVVAAFIVVQNRDQETATRQRIDAAAVRHAHIPPAAVTVVTTDAAVTVIDAETTSSFPVVSSLADAGPPAQLTVSPPVAQRPPPVRPPRRRHVQRACGQGVGPGGLDIPCL